MALLVNEQPRLPNSQQATSDKRRKFAQLKTN